MQNNQEIGLPYPWQSVEEIATHLSVSKETIWRLLEREKIHARRVGKLWRLKQSEVNQWVSGAASDPNRLELARA